MLWLRPGEYGYLRFPTVTCGRLREKMKFLNMLKIAPRKIQDGGSVTVDPGTSRSWLDPLSRMQKKKWISDDTYAVIREKREAKDKDKNRHQELKAEVQKKLRVDKQKQLEGMCTELEAANAKGNSRQVFQIIKSMTRKFQPRACNVSSQQLAKIWLKLHKSQTGGKGIVKICIPRWGREWNFTTFTPL